ncbi:DNA-binding transcription factor [Paraconiothyrium brasiliense]|uniref:C2H2 type master regulator of conidiophore development brlA n=1 Tax=Paraconiothyrium brasiliense TaxID=300254 RepID=A0ABR3RVD0_9PLEO
MNMSDFASSYDDTQRSVTNPPVSRPFQAPSSQLSMHGLPMFSAQPMTSSVPYQSGAFAFDSMTTNPYNMQQAYPLNYSTAMTHNVSYHGTSDIQPMPLVRTARNGFTSLGSPAVKSESTSPVQSHHGMNDLSYNQDHKRSTSEPSEGSGGNFATDVDTLMKAIQAKQSTAPSRDPAKVSDCAGMKSSASKEKRQEDESRPARRAAKRYVCTIPECGKAFYQKTHLDIHRRAHTGDKPFSFDAYAISDGFKSHQNKFHAPALRFLTQKFACINPGDKVQQEDKELWEYFASLYKNSNKGIKGRGKDRRITTAPSAAGSSSSYNGLSADTSREYNSYQHSGSERSSRCSSTISEPAVKVDTGYNFNTPLHAGYQQQSVYDDSAFPERRLY